jgi:hypothetical protein
MGDAADVRRLGDVVVGTALQGVERGGRPAFGERGEHDHRQPGVVLPKLLERLQPVHHRHLDVESHQVRVDLRDLGQRDLAVRRGADDLQPRVGGQDVAHQPPDDDRVVDHEHTDA